MMEADCGFDNVIKKMLALASKWVDNDNGNSRRQ